MSHSFILFDEDIALGTSPDAVIEKKKRSIDPIEESWEWVGRVAPKKPIQQDDTEKIFPSKYIYLFLLYSYCFLVFQRVCKLN